MTSEHDGYFAEFGVMAPEQQDKLLDREADEFLHHWMKFKYPWFCCYRERGMWWFRFWGYGLHWKWTTQHPLLFSERYGYSGWTWGNWHFGVLKP